MSGAVVGAAAGVAATDAAADIFKNSLDSEIATVGAIAGVFVSAFVISAAIAALEIWHKLDLHSHRRGSSIFAVFAFPWFCWFPKLAILLEMDF